MTMAYTKAVRTRSRYPIAIKDGIIELDFEGSSDQVRASVNFLSASQAFDAGSIRGQVLSRQGDTNQRWCLSLDQRKVPSWEFAESRPSASLRRPDDGGVCGGRCHRGGTFGGDPRAPSGWLGDPCGLRHRRDGGELRIYNSYDFGGTGARGRTRRFTPPGSISGWAKSNPPDRTCRVAGAGCCANSSSSSWTQGAPDVGVVGLGVRTAFRALEDVVVSIRTDHFLSPPSGYRGGDARPSAVYVLDELGGRRVLPSKAANVRVSAGGLFVIETSGGGGCGSPFERATEDVVRDVLDGRVSRESAVVTTASPSALTAL